MLEQLSSKEESKKGLALGESEKPLVFNYPYSGGGTGEQTSSREKRVVSSKLAGKSVNVSGRN